MIQRIQSVWLLLAAAAAFLSLQFPFYNGNMVDANNVKHIQELTAKSQMLLLILTAGEGIAALVAIFLFKNRKLQFRITLLTFLVSLINLVLFFLQTKQYVPGEGTYTLTAVFAIVVPVFLILAMRGIRKDDKLVKSLDRLR
jgi:peptidoglycan/LPS O-acetylase OafA/YrhL